MSRPRISQQTSSSALPLTGPVAGGRDTPALEPARTDIFSGPLQWLLDGPGWDILRPAVDFVLLCAAVLIAVGGIGSIEHLSAVRAPLLALPPLVLLLLHLRGLYRTRLRALVLDGLVPVTSGVSVAAMAVAMLGIFLNGRTPPQSEWVQTWLFALVGVAGGRMALALAQSYARARRLVGKPVLIMGAGVVGAQVARRLESHPEYGLAPVGFLDDDPRSTAEVGGRDVPVLGTIEDLDDAVRRTGVRNLIVAFSSVADARVSRLIQRCQELGIEVSVVPRMFDTINNRVGYDTVGGLPLMSFSSVDPKGLQFTLKHAFDRCFALFLLVALAPIILASALAVRLSSPGPVLFRQRRVGRDGQAFHLYKFRSMRIDPVLPARRGDAPAAPSMTLGMAQSAPGSVAQSAPVGVAQGALSGVAQGAPSIAPSSAASGFVPDPGAAPGGVEGADRRTWIGRLLRRTSLDELPQLFNVLKGEMSIIGPRPERPEFVELFGRDIARYGDRHRVKSGITGWAQVHGLRGQTSLADRVEWDNYYIAHWSLGLDLKILMLTVVSLFHAAE
ncbi:MAG TPA: exopolysaccharide biosynthesis polyprenyl glycosylphosphotransferase [Solirubrobacteraceae bacterium]|nr:exopolysaccharide biosynthesis polyprenyl glycosylphosphotransferase [Solirubrobacteraceae bacterium]